MKRINIFLIVAVVALCGGPLSAQLKGKAKLDSLLGELPKAKGDTGNVQLLIGIANRYRNSDYAKAVDYAKQAVALSNKLGVKKSISASNYCLGNIYSDHSDIRNTLNCYNIAVEIEKETGDNVALASLLNNMAATYQEMSDYPKALETNLKALKLFEGTGDQNGTANCLLNIGNIYVTKSDFSNATKYYLRALELYRKINAKHGVALALNNLGTSYCANQDYEIALKSFQEALKLYEAVGLPGGQDMALNNISGLHVKRAEYKEAIETGFRALKIARDNELPDGMGYDFKTISEAYYGIATNDSAKHSGITISKAEALKLAKAYVDSAMAKFTEVGGLNELSGAAEHASDIEAAYGNYRGAYTNYVLFKKLNDSVFNIEKDRKLTQSAMQYEFDKKEATARAEQIRKDIMHNNVRNFTMAGLAGALIFGVVVLRQRNRVKREMANVSKEKARSEELLLNILPTEVAEELKATGGTTAKHYDDVTVLFTDFVNFTQASENMGAQGLIDELHACFKRFDEITHKYNIEKIKTIGDAYLAVCGLPSPDSRHAENVVKAAIEINQFMQERLAKMGERHTFRIRIGIHSGSVVAGIVGVKKFAYDIWGDTVNTAARMEQNSDAGRINISETTYELVKDKFNCEYRGELEAKGKGVMKMYFVS